MKKYGRSVNRLGNLCFFRLHAHTPARKLFSLGVYEKNADEDGRRRFERYSIQRPCVFSEIVEAGWRSTIRRAHFMEQGVKTILFSFLWSPEEILYLWTT